MSSTYPNLGRHLESRKPMNTALLTGAIAVIVAAGILFVASFARTFIADGSQQDSLVQCALITTDAERLACYDVLGRQALRPPAKSANAPRLPSDPETAPK